MEIDVILFGLLWFGFIAFEIFVGVKLAMKGYRRLKKWHMRQQTNPSTYSSINELNTDLKNRWQTRNEKSE